MAPIKFEEHIKEQLYKREIRPSAQSWDKLSSRLEGVDRKSGKKWWVSAAAAVVVMIVASTIFINQEQNSNQVVETPLEIEENSVNENNDFEPSSRIASEEKTEVPVEKSEDQNMVNKSPKEIIPQNKMKNTSEAIAENTEPERKLIDPVVISPSESIEEGKVEFDTKITEVLSKVAQQEKKTGRLSEQEIDALLAEAVQEISDKSKFSEGSVSADALLADAEFELDQSFREEVFELLKDGFFKARTALATRND